MKLLEVLIERKVETLNRPFLYAYFGDRAVDTGFRVLVDFANSDLVAYVLKVTETNKTIDELEEETHFEIKEIKEVLDDKPLLNKELMELANQVSKDLLVPLISVLQAMLPPSLKPSKSTFRAPKVGYKKYLHILDSSEEGLTAKQAKILRLIKEKDILKSEVGAPSVVDKLIKLKRIEVVEKEHHRLVMDEAYMDVNENLTNDQIKAIKSIESTDKLVTLLQGVTGSGKTEVYLRLTEKCLENNRNVLMLVPEISLTPIMVDYFESRFKGKVAILHSELTDAQKYDEYRRIARGEANIVVGARSAIFAPLDNIGLIILDEEQTESYKQDNMPYYHARDIAQLRAKYHHAKVVLGSATPSLETKARAMKGVYNYVELPTRINKQNLPDTLIVDMSRSENVSSFSYIFSNDLLDAIDERLDRNEQTILLVNRRGYSYHLSCRNCGHIFKCPKCDIPLTYHKDTNSLKCHNCGHTEQAVDRCPKCNSKYLSRTGFGTERIEEELQKIFPHARILRLDSDIGKTRNNIAKVVRAFSEHKADILVGTQMVAKGHDFKDVTLVGIVSTDVGLTQPSFRSTERVFQLITQAVGRSGRSDKRGEAIIQTYQPKNYAVTLGAAQDYETFFKEEMMVRKNSQYPPYVYLVGVEISSTNEDRTISFAREIAENIKEKAFEGVTVLGPVEPYIAKENKNYKRQIFLKYKNNAMIMQYLANLLDISKSISGINIKIIVDPYNV